MLIVCPSCATSYDVEPAMLEPNGRQVRCVRCHVVWLAGPTRADKLLAAAEALGPANEEIAEVSAEPEPAPAGAWAEAIDESEVVDQSVALEGGQEGDPQDVEAVPDLAAAAEDDNAPEVDAPPIAPVDLDAGRPPIDIEAADSSDAPPAANDVESYAARFSRRAAKAHRHIWSLSCLQTAILVLIIVDAIIVGWRRDIVRMLPQTASFYALMGLSVNLRGLVFDAVTTVTEQHEGVPILVVQGQIVNRTGALTDVPRLKLAVRNAAKQEVYSWTAAPPRASLSPYQAVAFRTRLASPPPDSADVLVRFVNRRDIVAEPR